MKVQNKFIHVDNIICHMIYGYIRINEQILILSLNIFYLRISLKPATKGTIHKVRL